MTHEHLPRSAARWLYAVAYYAEDHGYRTDGDMPLAASHCLALAATDDELAPLVDDGIMAAVEAGPDDAASPNGKAWRLTPKGMAEVRAILGWQPYDEARAEAFDAWVRALDEDVVQGEYGYEPGEFSVHPEHWRPMFEEGLTPQMAFRRALDARSLARTAESGSYIEGDSERVY